MDNVCHRRLFSIPSKVEMAEEQEYLWHLYCPVSLIAAISHSSSASVMLECWQNYQSEGLPDPGIPERPFVKFSHRRFFAFSHHTCLSVQKTNIPIYNLQSETKGPTRSQNYGNSFPSHYRKKEREN